MAEITRVLCMLSILAIIIPSVLTDYSHEKHIIHVPVFIHYVHHHHILKKRKPRPRKKWKRVRSRVVVPKNHIPHFHAHAWYP